MSETKLPDLPSSIKTAGEARNFLEELSSSVFGLGLGSIEFKEPEMCGHVIPGTAFGVILTDPQGYMEAFWVMKNGSARISCTVPGSVFDEMDHKPSHPEPIKVCEATHFLFLKFFEEKYGSVQVSTAA